MDSASARKPLTESVADRYQTNLATSLTLIDGAVTNGIRISGLDRYEVALTASLLLRG